MPRKKSKARSIGKPNHNQVEQLQKELVKTDEAESQKQEKIK